MKIIKIKRAEREKPTKEDLFKADETIFNQKESDVNELLDSLAPRQREDILEEFRGIKQILKHLENRVEALEDKRKDKASSGLYFNETKGETDELDRYPIG